MQLVFLNFPLNTRFVVIFIDQEMVYYRQRFGYVPGQVLLNNHPGSKSLLFFFSSLLFPNLFFHLSNILCKHPSCFRVINPTRCSVSGCMYRVVLGKGEVSFEQVEVCKI